jgi:adenosine deaminase
VAELADRGIVLECCPTSNVVLGVFPSFDEHPLPALRDAGVRVTLGSDDPPYFGSSVGGEYDVARERFGMTDAELRAVTRTAIEASFAEPAVREALLRRVETTDGSRT